MLWKQAVELSYVGDKCLCNCVWLPFCNVDEAQGREGIALLMRKLSAAEKQLQRRDRKICNLKELIDDSKGRNLYSKINQRLCYNISKANWHPIPTLLLWLICCYVLTLVGAHIWCTQGMLISPHGNAMTATYLTRLD